MKPAAGRVSAFLALERNIALLLAAMYYFIVSYQRSEGSLSKERDSMKREVNNHPQRGWLEG